MVLALFQSYFFLLKDEGLYLVYWRILSLILVLCFFSKVGMLSTVLSGDVVRNPVKVSPATLLATFPVPTFSSNFWKKLVRAICAVLFLYFWNTPLMVLVILGLSFRARWVCLVSTIFFPFTSRYLRKNRVVY